MLKANFNITETGGTGIVHLQSSSDSGTTWHDVGSALALSQGALTVDDAANVFIDTSIFTPGTSYQFRLADAAGTPVSNVVTYTMPSITSYVSGISSIDFTPMGGDHYEVGFHVAPQSIQSVPSATVVGYEASVTFYHSLSSTHLVDDRNNNFTRSADYTYDTSGNGAGVYSLSCQYRLTNGLSFGVNRLVKVDASGTILADYQANGANITTVSGLDITIEANITQSGVSYDIIWIAMNAGTGDAAVIGSGNPATLTLPTFTSLLLESPQLDAVFGDDYDGDFFPNQQVVIA